LRRGGHLVVLRAPEDRGAEAVAILDRHGTVNIGERVLQWKETGWEGTFPENAGPYPSDASKETFPPDYHRSELSSDEDRTGRE
jgi:hypothetical protein